MSSERYSLGIVTGCHIQIRRVIRGTCGNGSSRTAWYSFGVKHSLELSCRPGLDILSFLDVGCLCVFPLDFLLRLLICDVFVVFALWLVVFALWLCRLWQTGLPLVVTALWLVVWLSRMLCRLSLSHMFVALAATVASSCTLSHSCHSSCTVASSCTVLSVHGPWASVLMLVYLHDSH